ncbi:helicase associated domain-containing protein [Gordonia hongkongensis]|uniref:helicase associated domain-containing protein n=1 Tax=Gordonia hongkongensis TaxID=1701090 RepID=UPI003EBB2DE3
MFTTGLVHLRRYAAAHGTSNARECVVIDGFAIGTWVASRRTDYRRGRLSTERVHRIETEFPDWRWTVRSRSRRGTVKRTSSPLTERRNWTALQ